MDKVEDEKIYTTYKGGKVKKVGDHFIFTAQPDDISIKVGDRLPDSWELLPANDATLKAMESVIPNNTPLNDDEIVIS